MAHSDELPLPKSGKEPLKVNVFDMARRGNTQLLPMFPYLGPGDIVPCSAAFESDGTSHKIGYFIHMNSVDEVALLYGAGGALRSGEMRIGPKTHGVGGDSGQPFFSVQTITQRNLEQGEQLEAIAFQCDKCNTELYRYEWDSTALGEECDPLLPTTIGGMDAALAWNDSEERRLCAHCGHQNPPFPLPIWGWQQHVRLTNITQRSRKALIEDAGQ